MQYLWNEQFCVGLRETDNQHKNFLELLNKMYDKYSQVTDNNITDMNKMQVYVDILKLREYAFNHFATEERYMVKYKYPKFFDHKREHDQFVRKVFELEDKLFDAKEMEVTEMIDFISGWLIHHICKIDQQFGGYLRDAGVLQELMAAGRK